MTTACASCPTCDLGLHHCHGLVARHDDDTWTCLDGCGGPLAVHDDVVDCVDLGLGCCSERPVVVEPERISVPSLPARAA